MKINLKKKLLLTLILSFSVMQGSVVLAEAKDDPLILKLMLDEFEKRDSRNSAESLAVVSAQAWLGRDLKKLWFKSDLEQADKAGLVGDVQILLSQAFAPYWDVQFGFKQDVNSKNKPVRTWGVLGVQGLAPYFFEVDAALNIAEGGRSSLSLDAEYELLLTQRLMIAPELSANLSGKADEEAGIGSGLSGVELGLRLSYEIRREFSPYAGVSYQKTLGETASFVKSLGGDTSEIAFVLGFGAWI